MRELIKLASIILCIGLTSCHFGNDTSPLDELQSYGDENQLYTVRTGDTLNVKVWGEPRLSGEVYVREDGRFTMPLVNDIDAVGKTIPQVSADVVKKLRQFVPAASVTISVSQSSPIRYYFSGNVQKPGDYRSDSRITLLQAIATAGGFMPFADESAIILIRSSAVGEQRFELDYNKVVEGSEPNPLLRDGDTIVVK